MLFYKKQAKKHSRRNWKARKPSTFFTLFTWTLLPTECQAQFVCLTLCEHVSIWQECTSYPWLVWASGTLVSSREQQVLCHITKGWLWKWIHFKRVCQAETCPLCKKTHFKIFSGWCLPWIFPITLSIWFLYHLNSLPLALLWRIHTHRHKSRGKPIMQIYMVRKKPAMCHNRGKTIKRNQLKPGREDRREC